MFDRKELKARGKAAFKKNFWLCVLVSIVIALCSGSVYSVANSVNTTTDTISQLDTDDYDYDISGEITDEDVVNADADAELGDLVDLFEDAIEEDADEASDDSAANVTVTTEETTSGGGILGSGVLTTVLDIFVLNIILVGGYSFYLRNRREDKPDLKELIMGFKDGRFTTICVTMFCKDIFTMLWTLLLIVPGVIKSYEYMMIPYLLAENPDMDRKEAFRISKELMKGNKWDAFVLDLSFVGWIVLGIITLGLGLIFYVDPYMDATHAELYAELKAKRPEAFAQNEA